MIAHRVRTALNRLPRQQRIYATRCEPDIKLATATMADAGACTDNLCDVYSTRVEDDRLYVTVLDSGNGPQITEKTDPSAIPETVLKYEQHTRKVNAAKRASADVTVEDHLRVIYADDNLVVVDKPSGVLCVPGVNHHSSLLTIVHQQFAPTIQPIDRLVIHRLDMDTSGLVIFGRTLEAVSTLHQQFRDRQVTKTYHALVGGHVMANAGRIDLPLQRDHERPPFMRVSTPRSEQAAAQVVQDLQHHGYKKLMQRKPKASTTEFQVLSREYYNGEPCLPVTRLLLKPITGRTHQLRVHCAALGHPIVGDPAYGIYGEASPNGGISEVYMDALSPHRASLELQRQLNTALPVLSTMCLHAKELSLKHPMTGEDMTWEAPTPF